MCPYARFQSAMFDRNTLIIAYDERRGEPRGPRKKGSLASVLERARGLLPKADADEWVRWFARHHSAADEAVGARVTTAIADPAIKVAEREKPRGEILGDCIDCTLCVQVCPTGIDIRNGLQYECIACGACVDACDSVMQKIGYPQGLVRYTSQNAVDGKPTRVLRKRVIVYGMLLLGLFAFFAWSALNRTPLIVDVLRDRGALFRPAADGGIENSYALRMINKGEVARTYVIRLADGQAPLTLVGSPEATLQAGEVRTVAITVHAPSGSVKGRRDLILQIRSTDGEVQLAEESRFFGPF
jgi:cytochrome c oxidase accessory protein FixG